MSRWSGRVDVEQWQVIFRLLSAPLFLFLEV